MSIVTDCRKAVSTLAERGDTFTEFDVANEASGMGTKGWTAKMFEKAVRDSYVVLSGEYKKGTLCRYGPVTLDSGNTDYARRGSKIVYASANSGPEHFETPNGDFPRVLVDSDPMFHVGRRAGSNRDDTTPWSEAKATRERSDGGTQLDPAPFLARIEQLQSEVNRLKKVEGKPTNGDTNGAAQHATSASIPVPDDMDLDEFVKLITERVKESLAEALIS
jgi:hypothetical protein